MEEVATSDIFAAWSDLGSLVLAAICFLRCGLDPSTPVWGRTKGHKISHVLAMTAALAFTLFRYVYEGITRNAGPREFHTILVIYIARWVYLWCRMNWPKSKESRMLEVAHALLGIRMYRAGMCSKDKQDPNESRQVGQAREIVIRRGVRTEPTGKPTYWRGVKVEQHFHPASGVYEVHLVQEGLYSEDLDPLGTIEFLSASQATIHKAYRRFYDVVVKAVQHRDPSPQETAAARSWQLPTPPSSPVAVQSTSVSASNSTTTKSASTPPSAALGQLTSASALTTASSVHIPSTQTPAPSTQQSASSALPASLPPPRHVQLAMAPDGQSHPIIPLEWPAASRPLQTIIPISGPAMPASATAGTNAPPGPTVRGTYTARTGETKKGKTRWRPSEVDFTMFFEKWAGNRVDRIADDVGATDARNIGRVARRIAADATYYINFGGENRTKEQVQLLNRCLFWNATELVGGPLCYDPEL